MKAAWLKNWKDVVISDRPVPELGHGEALIKVHYAGICGSDIHVFNGHHSTAIKPVIMGHEFSGEVVKLNGESHINIGDRVVVQPYTSCGICDACVRGSDNVCTSLKIFGIHTDGCFCEYIKVPLKKVYKIPDSISYRLATMTEPLAVAVHDVKRSGLSIGQTALIIGGGPIGLLIAMAAKRSGAAKIIISEINEYRLKVAVGMGFDVLNPLKDDVLGECMKITGGRGFDVVFEATGTPQGALLMTSAVKTCGNVIVIGVPKSKPEVDTGAILSRELNVLGVRVHAQQNFAYAVDILESMKDELSSLITHDFSLDDIKEAIDFSINDQEHIKVVLKI